MSKHTGKPHHGHNPMPSHGSKDKMAHSSHHDKHGEGDHKGMHGFGGFHNPPMEHDSGDAEMGAADCENTKMED